MKTGDLVLVKNETPHNEWPVGVVRRTFECQDELVRKVELAVVKDGKQLCVVSCFMFVCFSFLKSGKYSSNALFFYE